MRGSEQRQTGTLGCLWKRSPSPQGHAQPACSEKPLTTGATLHVHHTWDQDALRLPPPPSETCCHGPEKALVTQKGQSWPPAGKRAWSPFRALEARGTCHKRPPRSQSMGWSPGSLRLLACPSSEGENGRRAAGSLSRCESPVPRVSSPQGPPGTSSDGTAHKAEWRRA